MADYAPLRRDRARLPSDGRPRSSTARRSPPRCVPRSAAGSRSFASASASGARACDGARGRRPGLEDLRRRQAPGRARRSGSARSGTSSRRTLAEERAARAGGGAERRPRRPRLHRPASASPADRPGRVVAAIDPRKDVDGLTPTNAGLLVQGREALVPATPRGVMELLRRAGAELEGAEAVVVGRSDLVGQAGRVAAPRPERDRDRLPLAHARPRRGLPACRRARRRRRAPAPDHRRHGEARRDGDRRRHDPHGRRRRRATSTSIRRRDGAGDHAGARRRRPDDDRDAA